MSPKMEPWGTWKLTRVTALIPPKLLVTSPSSSRLMPLPRMARRASRDRWHPRRRLSSAVCRRARAPRAPPRRSEEHTSELQSRGHLVCRLLLEKKKKKKKNNIIKKKKKNKKKKN